MKAIRLKRGKEKSVLRRHPWIFSGAIAAVEGDPEDGEAVAILSAGGEPLATAHYESAGSIRARVLSFEAEEVTGAFWQRRLRDALDARRALGLVDSRDTTAYRLVNGEGDGLPGLIVDWYDGHAVLQAHSPGMQRDAGAIEAALRAVCGSSLLHVVHPGKEEPGTPAECEIRENGRRFVVNWRQGQKTGFFLDQRENRALLARYAGGRRVLNAFCYSGAFSVYALGAGAERVVSMDSSGRALEWTERNVAINGLDATRHRCVRADAVEFLGKWEEPFDAVILDPPAFAKHRSAQHAAIQAYKRINAYALRQVEPGGILFTFSCSQVIDRETFRGAVLAAAIEASRPIAALHELGQPPDHPVSLYHPEGAYLKGLVLRVG